MSIRYQGTYGPIEELIPPAPEGEQFVERSIPRHQTRVSSFFFIYHPYVGFIIVIDFGYFGSSLVRW